MKCSLKKSEIIEILVDEFERVSRDLDNSREADAPEYLIERNYGRYQALMDILHRVPIYEQ